ncbi:hypothetical protein [Bradyrhizobium retamae]|uniref:hypothetical protein n=1 Tax=Bradyrhizobium retamae TaxID=1300035 RepID=UPI0012E3BF18|nr:hypothetical protein [Bradyrhizobium retamae]
MIGNQRHCRCGAIYHRTEAMAASREIDSFECTACGATLENWDTAWVPIYRLITIPAIKPDETPPTASEP